MIAPFEGALKGCHINLSADFDAVFGEPTPIRFHGDQYIVSRGGHRGFVVGKEFMHFEQSPCGVEIAYIEWDAGITHPEASFVRLLKKKQHTMIRS